jgi:hypothetical protein
MKYFEIILEWNGQDIIQQIYRGNYEDLIKPWCSLLSNIYGQQTNNYDGYVHKVFKNDKAITLVCYLLEDETKIKSLKSGVIDWNLQQKNYIRDAIKMHIDRLNISSCPSITVNTIGKSI